MEHYKNMYTRVTILILSEIRYVCDYEFFSDSKFIYDYSIHCSYMNLVWTRRESVVDDPDVIYVSACNWYSASEVKIQLRTMASIPIKTKITKIKKKLF